MATVIQRVIATAMKGSSTTTTFLANFVVQYVNSELKKIKKKIIQIYLPYKCLFFFLIEIVVAGAIAFCQICVPVARNITIINRMDDAIKMMTIYFKYVYLSI